MGRKQHTAEQTYYRWRKEYGGLRLEVIGAADAAR